MAQVSSAIATDLISKLNLSRQQSSSSALPSLPSSIRNDAIFTSQRRKLQRQNSIGNYREGFSTFTIGITAGWHEELKSRKFWQAVFAEFVATAVFVAFGTGSVEFGQLNSVGDVTAEVAATPSLVLIYSFCFGLMIAVLAFGTGAISGGNLNPAVTISLMVVRKMSLLRGLFYIIAQCAGAVLGALYMFLLSPDLFNTVNGASNIVSSRPGITTWTAFGAEILGTALLVFTVHAAGDVGREKGATYVSALTPLMIGFAVFLAHLVLIPIDGCSINPARSLGSAVVSLNAASWANMWIFWAGPIIGGDRKSVV
jgi:aquaporin PIP